MINKYHSNCGYGSSNNKNNPNFCDLVENFVCQTSLIIYEIEKSYYKENILEQCGFNYVKFYILRKTI